MAVFEPIALNGTASSDWLPNFITGVIQYASPAGMNAMGIGFLIAVLFGLYMTAKSSNFPLVLTVVGFLGSFIGIMMAVNEYIPETAVVFPILAFVVGVFMLLADKDAA